jgi:hypothetical protein
MRLRRAHIRITDKNYNYRWSNQDFVDFTKFFDPAPRGCILTRTDPQLGLGGGYFTFNFQYADDVTTPHFIKGLS